MVGFPYALVPYYVRSNREDPTKSADENLFKYEQANIMIREIDNSDWPAFCRRVTEQRAGATVKLETIEPDGVRSELAADATFQGMKFEKTEACSDTITLRLRTVREIVREIVEPVQIKLHPSGGPGDFNPLEIVAESGVFFVTFHPAIHANMLNFKTD